MLGMPAHITSHSALERQLLIQLSGRLRAARAHRGWTASQVADQASISRTTLSAVESGAPSPAIGTYLKVLAVLGLPGGGPGLGSHRRGHRACAVLNASCHQSRMSLLENQGVSIPH